MKMASPKQSGGPISCFMRSDCLRSDRRNSVQSKSVGWIFLMTLLWIVDMALNAGTTLYMWSAEMGKSQSEASTVLGVLNRWIVASTALSWLSTTFIGCYYSFFKDAESHHRAMGLVCISVLGLVSLSVSIAASEAASLVAVAVKKSDDEHRARVAFLLCVSSLVVRVSQVLLGHNAGGTHAAASDRGAPTGRRNYYAAVCVDSGNGT